MRKTVTFNFVLLLKKGHFFGEQVTCSVKSDFSKFETDICVFFAEIGVDIETVLKSFIAQYNVDLIIMFGVILKKIGSLA